MLSDLNIATNEAVAASSRIRGSFSHCAPAFGWQTAILATAMTYATKRNASALEELRTE